MSAILARLHADAVLAEILRRMVVCTCALVLICAGQALPI